MIGRISRSIRVAATCAVLASLAACGTVAPYPFLAIVGGETMSLSTTDKTLGDHLASAVTGKDCSTFEALEKRPYCQPRTEPADLSVKDPYCYRTLGNVDCYDRTYKYPTPSQRVGG
ncbi:MAG: hypothetical protein WD270_08965 [Acetobacterales bacterium]